MLSRCAGSVSLKALPGKTTVVVPSRPFVAIPELDEDPVPVAEDMQLSADLPPAKQPPSEASRSLAHTLTRSLLQASASSLRKGEGAPSSPKLGSCPAAGDAALHKSSGMTTPRVSHVMLNGAEPDVLVRLDCDTSQSSTDVERGPDDSSVPPAISPSVKHTSAKQSASFAQPDSYCQLLQNPAE